MGYAPGLGMLGPMERAIQGADVAIVGAGLIGLATAFELAQRGARVRVFDRGEPARAASWAGAGMLAPHTERLTDETMLAFCAESLAMYPGFVERVTRASGIEVELSLEGIVNAAFDEAKMEQLREHARELATRGIACDVLDRNATLAAQPALARHVVGALTIRGEGYVDNRRLGRALAAACEAAGISIVREAREVALECDERRVLGVRSDRGFAPASTVVVAAGAWTATIPGLPPACAPPVTPVKGQMLSLAIPRGFVRRTTWVPGAYLVPREDGRLLIGATAERVGFDERVTARGLRQLLDNALAAAPALGDFSVTETWAGLRPGSPDERPTLGPTPCGGLVLATGHYRNGILLAPITARAVADFVATGDAAPLAPWSLARFGKDAPHAARMA